MAEQTKHNINIKIADLTPIPLQIKLEDEKTYRDAEALRSEEHTSELQSQR